MNEKIAGLVSRLHLNAAPTQEDIRSLLEKIDFKIDYNYIDFIKSHNGATGNLNENSYVLLWGLEDVAQLNPYYEDVEECNKLFFFGSNGGNDGYGFDKENSTIVAIVFLDIAYSEPIKIADSFKGFLEKLTNYPAGAGL